jgi:hypothetical protein
MAERVNPSQESQDYSPQGETSEDLPVELYVETGQNLRSKSDLDRYMNSEQNPPVTLFERVQSISERGFHSLVGLSKNPRQLRIIAARQLDNIAGDAEQAVQLAQKSMEEHPTATKAISAGVIMVALGSGYLFARSRKK